MFLHRLEQPQQQQQQRRQCHQQKQQHVHLFALPLRVAAAAQRRAGLRSIGGNGGGGAAGGLPARESSSSSRIVLARSDLLFGGHSARAEAEKEEATDATIAWPVSSPSMEAAAAAVSAKAVDAGVDTDDAKEEEDEARALALEAQDGEQQEQQEQRQQFDRGDNQSKSAQEEEDDDEVLAVVLAAARAAGREPGPAERALARRLRDNWYATARDVAALSAEELGAMGAPLRVRAAAAAAVAEAEAAAEALSGAAEPGGEGGAGAPAPAEGGEPQPPEQALDPDIMKRRAPPRRRAFKRGSVRVTRKAPGASWVGGGAAGAEGSGSAQGEASGGGGAPPSSSSSPSPSRHSYGLLVSEMHPSLAAELERLERFCTERTLGRRRPPVAASTHQGTVRYLRLLLGWLARVKKAAPSPGEILSLRQAFPSRGREGAALLFEFRDFLERERGANARTVFNAMMAASHAVRFLWGEGGEGGECGSGGEGDEGGSGGKDGGANNINNDKADPPVLIEVRAMAGAAFKQTRRCPLVSDESKKWLTWQEYASLVEALRRECAGLTPAGNPRSPREVAACLQRYLIFAFLACIPDRQRTLRELRVGRTLVKEPLTVRAGAVARGAGGMGAGNGNDNSSSSDPPYRWVVRHGAADYKTGRLYGPRPPLVVAPFLYPELEAYVSEWRRHLHPQHDFLFTTVSSKGGGRPLTASSLYKLFSHTALVFTGRPMNPHLMRDLVVTHLRSVGTSEEAMEALSVYMAHSVAQQRATYDRRTRAQKAFPAVELMAGLVAGQGGGGGGGGGGAATKGSDSAAVAVRGMFSDGLNL